MTAFSWEHALSIAKKLKSFYFDDTHHFHDDSNEKAKAETHVIITSLQDECISYIPCIYKSIYKYLEYLDQSQDDNNNEEDRNDEHKDKIEYDFDIIEQNKQRIIQVRKSLRFGLACLSFPPHKSDDNETQHYRMQFQNKAIMECKLHHLLSRLLGHQASSSSTTTTDLDLKCRLYAARFWNNLITSNPHASQLVSIEIPLSLHNNHNCISNDHDDDEKNFHVDVSSWVDMISESSRCTGSGSASASAISDNGTGTGENDTKKIKEDPGRDILAAIAATLHNILAAIHPSPDPTRIIPDIHENEILDAASDNSHFAVLMAQDKLLVSNLLRHVLPVSAVSPSSSSSHKGDPSSHEDSATEWIIRLLSRLNAHYGLLPTLYSSAGPTSLSLSSSSDINHKHNYNENNNHKNDRPNVISWVTPEQVVLLHCINHTLEEFSQHHHDYATYPLGYTSHQMQRSLSFVFQEIEMMKCTLMSSTSREPPSHDNDDKNDNSYHSNNNVYYEGHMQCYVTAYICMLDIISSIYSWANTEAEEEAEAEAFHDDPNPDPYDADIVNNDQANYGKNHTMQIQWRQALITKESNSLTQTILHLGHLLDQLLYQNNSSDNKSSSSNTNNKNTKIRDLKISNVNQEMLKSLVRLIGNICYHTPRNQDLLRTTLVPFKDDKHKLSSTKDNDNASSKSKSTSTSRTGLHVLLSCTSLSYACFGLREWAVVAIRNALEYNPDNQSLVEGLEGQGVASDSTSMQELDRLGLKVDMDSYGKVNVERKT